MADRSERVFDNPETLFEDRDWKLAIIAVLAIVTFAFVLVIPLVLRGSYPEAMGDAAKKQTVVPPAPLLQTDPPADLEDFRAEEEARLNSYGWVDRSKGIVHIPITRAMTELAAKGIPDFPKGKP